jgi:hypothetical protein
MLTIRYFRQFRSRVAAWCLLFTYGALGWLATAFAGYGWMRLQMREYRAHTNLPSGPSSQQLI